jgi:putative holliday junction resolvase
MGRILAIDFGKKRTGIAVSDPLRIIAGPLETIDSKMLIDFLTKYVSREVVDEFVIGMPKQLNNLDSEMAPFVRTIILKIKEVFPDKPVHEVDERFTSSIAKQTMIAGGMKKKDRRDKSNADKISAVLILQAYMNRRIV